MTQRIIISILFLVTVSLGTNRVSGAPQREQMPVIENNLTDTKAAPAKEVPSPVKNMPTIPAPKPEAPHHKSMQAPHMEEIPHIHRYHKERVKKVKQHHSKLWFLSQFIVVICQVSLLVIAYLHIVH